MLSMAILSIVARNGATFAACGGRLSGCALGRGMQRVRLRRTATESRHLVYGKDEDEHG